MDNSFLDVLVIVGAVLITIISAVAKARKKAADKQSGAEADNSSDSYEPPIPNPWQEIFSLPTEEEDDFIPKNPEEKTIVVKPKMERQPLIKPGIDYEPRNFMEEMALVKAKEREKRVFFSKYKAMNEANDLELSDLSDVMNDSGHRIDLELDKDDAWKRVVIYHELLEPKF